MHRGDFRTSAPRRKAPTVHGVTTPRPYHGVSGQALHSDRGLGVQAGEQGADLVQVPGEGRVGDDVSDERERAQHAEHQAYGSRGVAYCGGEPEAEQGDSPAAASPAAQGAGPR